MSPHSQASVGTVDLPTVHWTLIVVTVLIVLIGIVVFVARYILDQRDSRNSVVRSWIALTLVAGLLLFCGVSLGVDDSSMRSTLFGGLIAGAGAATAFYFSSQNSDQARKDILDASFGTIEVPKLIGTTVEEAQHLMSRTALELRTQSPDATPEDTVAGQTPDAGTSVRRGSLVLVTTKPTLLDNNESGRTPPNENGKPAITT